MTAPLELWYRGPATEWTDALPLGNGRLGAMVFGGVVRDEFQLNEDTLWSGGPYQPINPVAKGALGPIQELIFAGDYSKAEKLANESFLARPYLQTSYQPAGRLFLTTNHQTPHSCYRRSLRLDDAVSVTEYQHEGVTYCREAFVSASDGILVIHLTANQPGKVSVEAEYLVEHPGEFRSVEGGIYYHGRNISEVGIAGQLEWVFQLVH